MLGRVDVMVQVKRPELARVAESVDLTKPTLLTSDSSSDASSSSSSSDADDSATNSSCSCDSCQKARPSVRSLSHTCIGSSLCTHL